MISPTWEFSNCFVSSVMRRNDGICTRISSKIISLQKQQRQDLILTLKTYLEHNQNLTKTAQDLYIHYKTAAYRIERISQITGIDFDNPNEVLSVRIGLVVCKMMENLKNSSFLRK